MKRTGIRIVLATVALLVLVAAVLHLTHWSTPVLVMLRGKKTVNDRLAECGTAVRARLEPRFAAASVAFPPRRMVLVALKRERRMELWAADDSQGLRRVTAYPIQAASGTEGPKLRRGDNQVPEGVYAIDSLNPNSRFYLALRVAFPNAFDRAMAKRDGRIDLGSDIMIHGKAVSAGCLAIGDEAAEDLFILTALTGLPNVTLIIAPCNLRTAAPLRPPPTAWSDELYARIRSEMPIAQVGSSP